MAKNEMNYVAPEVVTFELECEGPLCESGTTEEVFFMNGEW